MKSLNVATLALTAISLISLILITFRFDPFAVGWSVKALFFASLFLFLAGSGALIFTVLMVKIRK